MQMCISATITNQHTISKNPGLQYLPRLCDRDLCLGLGNDLDLDLDLGLGLDHDLDLDLDCSLQGEGERESLVCPVQITSTQNKRCRAK